MTTTETEATAAPRKKRERLQEPGTPLGPCVVCGGVVYSHRGYIMTGAPTIIGIHWGTCQQRLRSAWAGMLATLAWEWETGKNDADPA